jgi:hypothetical protein
MELEQVKAAWQREKAAYPYETDPAKILADTRQQAMKRDQEFARKQRTQIICSLICLGLMARCYSPHNPLLANVGLIVMLLGSALMLAGSIILKYRLRVSHPELPRKEFLAEQRRKISARIALLQNNMTWFLIPAMLGFLLWQVTLSHSIQMKIVLIILAALACVGAFWCGRWQIRRELRPMLEEIDRELDE